MKIETHFRYFQVIENQVQWQTCKKIKFLGPTGLCQVRICSLIVPWHISFFHFRVSSLHFHFTLPHFLLFSYSHICSFHFKDLNCSWSTEEELAVIKVFVPETQPLHWRGLLYHRRVVTLLADLKNWQVEYIDILQVACIYMYVDFLSWQVEYIDIWQVAYICIYVDF